MIYIEWKAYLKTAEDIAFKIQEVKNGTFCNYLISRIESRIWPLFKNKGVDMSMDFYVVIEKDEDGFYVGEVPALKGCYAQGKKH